MHSANCKAWWRRNNGLCIQKRFVKIGVDELDWPVQSPDLNPIGHLWDELERRVRVSPNRPTSVPDVTNSLVADWKQVPAAMFQNLVESLPGRVETVIASKGGTNSILMPMILE